MLGSAQATATVSAPRRSRPVVTVSAASPPPTTSALRPGERPWLLSTAMASLRRTTPGRVQPGKGVTPSVLPVATIRRLAATRRAASPTANDTLRSRSTSHTSAFASSSAPASRADRSMARACASPVRPPNMSKRSLSGQGCRASSPPGAWPASIRMTDAPASAAVAAALSPAAPPPMTTTSACASVCESGL